MTSQNQVTDHRGGLAICLCCSVPFFVQCEEGYLQKEQWKYKSGAAPSKGDSDPSPNMSSSPR